MLRANRRAPKGPLNPGLCGKQSFAENKLRAQLFLTIIRFESRNVNTNRSPVRGRSISTSGPVKVSVPYFIFHHQQQVLGPCGRQNPRLFYPLLVYLGGFIAKYSLLLASPSSIWVALVQRDGSLPPISLGSPPANVIAVPIKSSHVTTL